MTFWLLFLRPVPTERCELIYILSGAVSGEVRVTADGEAVPPSTTRRKAYCWNGKTLQQWDGRRRVEQGQRGPLCEGELSLALFLDTREAHRLSNGRPRGASWAAS